MRHLYLTTLLLCLVLFTGCEKQSTAPVQAADAEYEKQRKESARQLDATARQLEAMEKQIQRSEQQAERFLTNC